MIEDYEFQHLAKIPSKGKFYPVGHPFCNKTFIPLKTMLVKHEAMLMNSYLRKTQLIDQELLRAITGISDLDVFNLLAGDVAALYFSIFISNYEYQFEKQQPCMFCGENNDCVIMIDTFPLRTCNYDPDEPNTNKFTIHLPKMDKEVQIKFPTHGEILESSLQEKTMASSLLRMQLVSFDGKDDPKLLDYVSDKINLSDVQIIRRFIYENEPGVIAKYKFFCTNTNCKRENVISFAYGAEMFGIGPEHKEDVLLKPAWLLSYMSGEQFESTLSWPVAYRRWWIKEIENDIKARSERKDDIADKAPPHISDPSLNQMLGKPRIQTPNAKSFRF